MAHLEDEGVHHVGHVAIVGQQHPALGLVQSQQLVLGVEFDAIRFLVIPQERAVAASPDMGTTGIVGEGALCAKREIAGFILLSRSDRPAVGGGQIELEHLVRFFRLR